MKEAYSAQCYAVKQWLTKVLTIPGPSAGATAHVSCVTCPHPGLRPGRAQKHIRYLVVWTVHFVLHTIHLILQASVCPLVCVPEECTLCDLAAEVVDMLTPVIRTLVLLSIQLESNIFNWLVYYIVQLLLKISLWQNKDGAENYSFLRQLEIASLFIMEINVCNWLETPYLGTAFRMFLLSSDTNF